MAVTTMFWAISDHEKQVMEEIEEGSDRAVGIVAASIVEDRVTTAIQKYMKKDEKVIHELFRPSGPLGTFSTKIDLGYLMGLYKEQTRKDLHTIREIRNEFAHDLLTQDFGADRVRDLANNITAPDRIRVTIKPVDDQDGSKGWDLTKPEPGTTFTPRERFVMACQIYLMGLRLVKLKRPPEPEL